MDAAKTLPTTKNYLDQNVNSAESEKPWFSIKASGPVWSGKLLQETFKETNLLNFFAHCIYSRKSFECLLCSEPHYWWLRQSLGF